LRSQPHGAEAGTRSAPSRRASRPRALDERRTGRVRLLASRAPRLQDALAALLTPEPDGRANIFVPFEPVGLVSPAEHGRPPASRRDKKSLAAQPQGAGTAPRLRPNRGVHGTLKQAIDQPAGVGDAAIWQATHGYVNAN
jgi:hypothetical protein